MARAGFAYLRRHPALAGFGIASVIPWVATISLNVVIVAYVLQVLAPRGDRVRTRRHDLRRRGDGVGRLRGPARRCALGEWRAMTARDGGADRLLRGARRRAGRDRGLLRRALPGRLLLVGVPRHHLGVPLQGRAQRGDGADVVDVPARLDAAPGDRDPVDRPAREPRRRARRVRRCSPRSSPPGSCCSWPCPGCCGGCRTPRGAASKPGREPGRCAARRTRDGQFTSTYAMSTTPLADRPPGRRRRIGRGVRVEQRRLDRPGLDPCARAPVGVPGRGGAARRAVPRHRRVLGERRAPAGRASRINTAGRR